MRKDQTSLAESPAVKEKFFYQAAAKGVVMTKTPFARDIPKRLRQVMLTPGKSIRNRERTAGRNPSAGKATQQE